MDHTIIGHTPNQNTSNLNQVENLHRELIRLPKKVKCILNQSYCLHGHSLNHMSTKAS